MEHESNSDGYDDEMGGISIGESRYYTSVLEAVIVGSSVDIQA
jgi:hypothetical protein